jgi:hypothetical protein
MKRPDRPTAGWKMRRPRCQLPGSLCHSRARLPAAFSEVDPTVRTQPNDVDLYGTIPILPDFEVPAHAFLRIERRGAASHSAAARRKSAISLIRGSGR